jgi:hypothetical protein
MARHNAWEEPGAAEEAAAEHGDLHVAFASWLATDDGSQPWLTSFGLIATGWKRRILRLAPRQHPGGARNRDNCSLEA